MNKVDCNNLISQNPDLIYFAYLHPDDGRAIRYHFDEFMVEWIPQLAKSLTKNLDLSEWQQYCTDDLLQLLIEQSLYFELVETGRAIFRRNFALRMGWEWNKPVYVNSQLAKLVKKNTKGQVAETVVSSITLRSIKPLVSLRRFCRDALLLRSAHYKNNKYIFSLPMVAVELVEGVDPVQKNDAFWMSKDAVDPSRVLFIVEPQNLSLFNVNHTLEYVRKVGAYIVTTDHKIAKSLQIPHWKPAANIHKEKSPDVSKATRLCEDSGSRDWLSLMLSSAADRIKYWTQFFEQNNIAIYQHFTEGVTDSAIRRIASYRADVLQVGKMRSQFFEWNAAAFHFQHQVAMVWNENVREVLLAAKTRTDLIIETGYPNDYRLSSNHKLDLKRPKFDCKVKVICVVYDNHPHKDNHFSYDDLETFFNAIISVAKEVSSLGLLVKSKKPRILSNLKSVKDELELLTKEGRCIILSGKSDSAAENALYADIAVGIPCSTAACEASLMGCAAFIFDPSGANRLSPKNAPNVIFRKIDDFKFQLERAVRGLIDEKSQSDFRVLLVKKSNETARIRAARFLNTYLCARQKRKNVTESLSEAIMSCKDYVYSVTR